jgi:hypothetical protein
MLTMNIGDKLFSFMLLGVVTICVDNWCMLKLIQNFSCESRRSVFASDIVILHMAPVEEVVEGNCNGSLSAANSSNWDQYDILSDIFRRTSSRSVLLTDNV